MTGTPRYAPSGLISFATAILTHAGIRADRAGVVAGTLVEADLMGHSTHGLQLLPAYAKEAKQGKMKGDGEPEVISDLGAAITWDGHYLPGPWLVHHAMDLCFERILEHPVVTVAIRRSHHIACLAAYPARATDKGLMMWLSSSDPWVKTIAPFGGRDPVFTPNPIAAGIPTGGTPIIFDISTSTTSNGLVMRTLAEGKKLPHPWLLTAKGKASDDPAEFVADPAATILPLGGLDSGHKGYALALFVEALTGGLSGFGRADKPGTWGASVFLQVIDPDFFGGAGAFQRQMDFVADACRQSRPVSPGTTDSAGVRLPGQHALRLRDEQQRLGVALHPTIPPLLEELARTFGIPAPTPGSL